MEKWSKCELLPDCYLVSNYGKIKSVTRYIVQRNGVKIKVNGVDNMKHHVTKTGYHRITLIVEGKRKNYLIHQLVAVTFIPNPEKKLFVNHKNGIKSDNYEENLEWNTALENEHHKQSFFNNNNYPGINITKSGKYEVRFKNKYLGRRNTLEEAIKLYKENYESTQILGSMVLTV